MTNQNDKLEALWEWVYENEYVAKRKYVSDIIYYGAPKRVVSSTELHIKIQKLMNTPEPKSEKTCLSVNPESELLLESESHTGSDWRVNDRVVPHYDIAEIPNQSELDRYSNILKSKPKAVYNIDAELRAKDAEIERLKLKEKRDQEIAESNNLYCQQLENRIEQLSNYWRTDLENAPKNGKEYLFKKNC